MYIFCLAPEGLRDLGITFSVCVVCDVRKMLKVFELSILLSSAMNMITQIIFKKIEVGDWYYTQFV